MKIGLVCIPNVGHLVPIANLAEALKEKGHEVTIVSIGNAKGKVICPRLLDAKNIPYILTDGPEESVMYENAEGNLDPSENYIGGWEKHAVSAINNLMPDLVVSDLGSRNGAIAADLIGVPCVINVNIPIAELYEFGKFKVIDTRKMKSCCGCLCLGQTILHWVFKATSCLRSMKTQHKYFDGLNERCVLLNTFWGYERAQCLPPNFVVTGPLFKTRGNVATSLAEKDKELHKWLNQALLEKQKVVYVSIGTEC